VTQKILEGTYRSDRDGNRAEVVVAEIVPPVNEFPVPKEITDEYVIKYFSAQINFLTKLNLLQECDIPHLTQMFIILQQLREVNKEVEKLQKDGIMKNLENYDVLVKLMSRLTERYNNLANSYYITPYNRTKLTLDALNIEKLKTENTSITSKLINKKRA